MVIEPDNPGDSDKSESSGWAQPAPPSVRCLGVTKYAREEWVAAEVEPAEDKQLLFKAAPHFDDGAAKLSEPQSCWPFWSRWTLGEAKALKAAEGFLNS